MFDLKLDLKPILLTFIIALAFGTVIGYIGGYNIVVPMKTFFANSASGAFIGAAAAQSHLIEALAVFINNTVFVAAVGLGFPAFKRFGSLFLFLITAYTGGIIGTVFGLGLAVLGAPVTIAAILPHGIIELSAVVIGFAIGHYGIRLRRNDTSLQLQDTVFMNARTFIAVCIPLLLIAAFVETYLTPIALAAVM